MIRFTKDNWARFKTHNKKTTIRSKVKLPGRHVCMTGWTKAGYCDISNNPIGKMVKDLTEQDAINDGFDSLCELLLELGRLNVRKGMTPDTMVFIHRIKVMDA